jgi:hypothetical protein
LKNPVQGAGYQTLANTLLLEPLIYSHEINIALLRRISSLGEQ